jgi:hypothetical protein
VCDGPAFADVGSVLGKSGFQTVSGNIGFSARSILIRLDANVMVDSRSEPLLAAEVLFGRLNTEVTK